MENLTALFALLIILGLLVYIVFTVFKLLYDIVVGYRNFSRGRHPVNNPSRLTRNHPVVIGFLDKFPYYRALSVPGKEKFCSRLIIFLADKKFVGMKGLTVTDEMRVLISATAVQLTFGLENFLLHQFHTFRIYEEEFYSKLAEAHLKGGTTSGGTMMLSWKDFQKGYAIGDDKLNLGIHEMAHALILDMLHGKRGNPELAAEIGHWERMADVEIENLRQKRPHFLRAYGGVNEHEFFAVSVEHFFETPVEFKTRLPDIYSRLCILLNQDPANTSRDYRLWDDR